MLLYRATLHRSTVGHSRESGNPDNNWIPGQARNDEKDKTYVVVYSNLIARYKNNVLFVHIPQKTEVVYQKVNSLGEMARRDIHLLGGELYDGHALCNLTKEDYFIHDGHPNESGYAKISACVTAAVKTSGLYSKLYVQSVKGEGGV